MVDSGAINSFVHCKFVQQLNTTTVDAPDMGVSLADGSYIDCSIFIPLYLQLCEIYNKVPLKSLKLYM